MQLQVIRTLGWDAGEHPRHFREGEYLGAGNYVLCRGRASLIAEDSHTPGQGTNPGVNKGSEATLG